MVKDGRFEGYDPPVQKCTGVQFRYEVLGRPDCCVRARFLAFARSLVPWLALLLFLPLRFRRFFGRAPLELP